MSGQVSSHTQDNNAVSFALNPRFTAIGALSTETILLDERSLSERLSFSAQFAKLVVYFNQSNQADGNWQRLLLKDPVILLATISHMDYRQTHRLFLLLQHRLTNVDGAPLFIAPAPGESFDPKHQVGDSLTQSFNQLLALLQQLFVTINDWVVHMDSDDKQYNIKQFVNQQVNGQLSLLLAQYLTVFKLAFANYQDIDIPDIKLFEQFDDTWFDGHFNQQPEHLAENSDLVEIIGQIYYQVFGFYVQVIKAAGSSFENFKDGVNHYPDTALLVAFVKLLEHQQAQQNTLTKKHLDFYYQQVLQQSPAIAKPDDTYVMVKLKSTTQVLTLPQGTTFSAGVDSQGVAQEFVSVSDKFLNQGQILALQTLRYQQPQHRRALIFNQIEKPTQLQKDPQGQIVSWPLLGAEDDGSVAQQGFCIASPLLSLAGGDRTITLDLEFTPERHIDGAQLLDCQCFLSTKSAWLKADIAGVNLIDSKLRVVLNVDKTQPPIENFVVPAGQANPDGFNAKWPMFKLLLSGMIPLTYAVTMKSLTISCEVKQCPQVALYANDALVSPGGEFQPFGPIANAQNRFYIGSDEVFAKPITALSVTFEWSKLPTQMVEYYQTYNQYLNNKDLPLTSELEAATTPFNNKETWTIPYNNQAFYTGFYWFGNGGWQNIAVNISDEDKFIDDAPSASDPDAKITPHYQVYLFIEDKPSTLSSDKYTNVTQKQREKIANELIETFDEGQLASLSQFIFTEQAITTIKPDVSLLSQGLDFTSDNKSGFVAMELTQPGTGFGQDIYPQVVTAVTQQNGLQMILLGKSTTLLEDALMQSRLGIKNYQPIALPNVPYAPAATSLTLNYVASKTYDLTTTNDYPLQYFHRDSFSTYQVYDADANEPVVSGMSQAPRLDKISTLQGIPVFAGVANLACTYVFIEGLQPPCNLSLYCHLEHLVSLYEGQSLPPIDAYYLSVDGWKKLHILDDQTNNLSCSGAIEVFIDADIAQSSNDNNGLMPNPKGIEADVSGVWLAIAADGTEQQFANMDFIDTQAVKVERVLSAEQQRDTDVELYLPADSITGLVVANNGVDKITQPFASLGGKLAQTEQQFYRATSARIANKGRVSSSKEFCQQVFDYVPDLYFCQHIPAGNLSKKNPSRSASVNLGEVKLALIQGYGATEQLSALRPSVPPCELAYIKESLAANMSPFVDLQVFNFKHTELKVEASLVFVANVAVNQLLQQINQQLKWFLSPWIEANQLQRDITTPLTRSSLLAFLSSYAEVSSVASMTLTVNGNEDNRSVLDVGIDSVLISSNEHQLTASTAESSLQSIREGV